MNNNVNKKPGVFQKLLKEFDGDVNNPEFKKKINALQKKTIKNNKSGRPPEAKRRGLKNNLELKLKDTIYKNMKNLTITSYSQKMKIDTPLQTIGYELKEDIVFFKDFFKEKFFSLPLKKESIVDINKKIEKDSLFELSATELMNEYGIKDSSLSDLFKSYIYKVIIEKKNQYITLKNICKVLNVKEEVAAEVFAINLKKMSNKRKIPLIRKDFFIKDLKKLTILETFLKYNIPEPIMEEIVYQTIYSLIPVFGALGISEMATIMGTREKHINMLMNKEVLQNARVIKNSPFSFASNYLTKDNKKSLTYSMISFAFTHKHVFSPKYMFTFQSTLLTKTGEKDIYSAIIKLLRKEELNDYNRKIEQISNNSSDNIAPIKKAKYSKDEIIKLINQTFRINNLEENLFDILLEEGVLVTAFGKYLIQPRLEYKNDIIEFTIAKNFKKEFDVNKQWHIFKKNYLKLLPEKDEESSETSETSEPSEASETLIKDKKSSETSETSETLIKDKKSSETSETLIKVTKSLMFFSKSLTLYDKNSFIFTQDLIEYIPVIEPLLNEFEAKANEIGIWSLQRYWNFMEENLKKQGVISLQMFYSLLDMHKGKKFECLRYPSISSLKNAERFKNNEVTVKELYREAYKDHLSSDENRDYLGLHSPSFRQYFKKS